MEATLHIENLETRLATLKIIETCAWCQRIKVEGHLLRKSHWVERQTIDVSSENVLFSHGICPQCKQRLTEEN